MRRRTARSSREEVMVVPVFCGVARFDVSATLVTGAGGGVLTMYAICAEACADPP